MLQSWDMISLTLSTLICSATLLRPFSWDSYSCLRPEGRTWRLFRTSISASSSLFFDSRVRTYNKTYRRQTPTWWFVENMKAKQLSCFIHKMHLLQCFVWIINFQKISALKTQRIQGEIRQKEVRLQSSDINKWHLILEQACVCVRLASCHAFSIYTARRSLRATISCLSLVRVVIKAWLSAAAASKSSFGPSPMDSAPILTLLSMNQEKSFQ